MAPSYECVGSSLFCAEDNNSIMGFDDDEHDNGVDDGEIRYQHGQSQCLWVDNLMDFPVQTDESLGFMIEKECQYMPREDYTMRLQTGVLDVSLRRAAIDWIWKVHAHHNFGPLTAYLSVNYLDRFLSAYQLSPSKPWMLQLLSVTCLSLAAKMDETEVPLSLDLQVCESKFIFEARTIQRMELLVLSTLRWRMQAVTPFSFMDYLLQKINDDKPPPRSSICRSVELILGTVRGIDFLKFKPSEVAAAVAISVSVEAQSVDFNEAVSCCIHVEKERVFRCHELIQEMILKSSGPVKAANGSVLSVPQSPIGVLDASCLTYKSDDTTVESSANSHTTPAAKRSKRNRLSEMDMKL